MAKLEKIIKGDWKKIIDKIEDGILRGSVSATLEESTDIVLEDVKCSIRVFERFSWVGSNRVSLAVTLIQKGDDDIHLVGISSGGSQARFMKLNTVGEESFLDKLKELI